MVPNGLKYREGVPVLTRQILSFLRRNQWKITFFAVGDQLRDYPGIVEEILADGHELACHTDTHQALAVLGPDGFRRDLECWRKTCAEEGWPTAIGFRAPTFSLVEQTSWAYRILHEFGFCYSSSVLPARHPLFGWEEFGEATRQVDGVIELPMRLGRFGPWRVPFGGGVYFRVIPWWLIHRWLRQKLLAGETVPGYLHPYDIDTQQEKFAHPGLPPGKHWQWLMFAGRAGVFSRLQSLSEIGFRVTTYRDYLKI